MVMAMAALFSSIFEFLLFVGALAVLYQIFLSDWIAAKRSQWKEASDKAGSMNKIAQIKMVSDDAKGIEQFVTENAQFLSEQMVAKLVARIEEIKAGNVITADELLKTRIAELPPQEELEEEEEEEEEDTKTRSRHANGV